VLDFGNIMPDMNDFYDLFHGLVGDYDVPLVLGATVSAVGVIGMNVFYGIMRNRRIDMSERGGGLEREVEDCREKG
jgi:hypothetical protein